MKCAVEKQYIEEQLVLVLFLFVFFFVLYYVFVYHKITFNFLQSYKKIILQVFAVEDDHYVVRNDDHRHQDGNEADNDVNNVAEFHIVTL